MDQPCIKSYSNKTYKGYYKRTNDRNYGNLKWILDTEVLYKI